MFAQAGGLHHCPGVLQAIGMLRQHRHESKELHSCLQASATLRRKAAVATTDPAAAAAGSRLPEPQQLLVMPAAASVPCLCPPSPSELHCITHSTALLLLPGTHVSLMQFAAAAAAALNSPVRFAKPTRVHRTALTSASSRNTSSGPASAAAGTAAAVVLLPSLCAHYSLSTQKPPHTA
jgi:hypothetical protein